MQCFTDHCVPTDLIVVLEELGFNVQQASEQHLERATDEEIFQHARRHGQVLITTDRDFGNIIRFNIRTSPGIVIIELEGMSKMFVRRRVQGFFREVKPHALRGRLHILEPTQLRVWPRR